MMDPSGQGDGPPSYPPRQRPPSDVHDDPSSTSPLPSPGFAPSSHLSPSSETDSEGSQVTVINKTIIERPPSSTSTPPPPSTAQSPTRKWEQFEDKSTPTRGAVVLPPPPAAASMPPKRPEPVGQVAPPVYSTSPQERPTSQSAVTSVAQIDVSEHRAAGRNNSLTAGANNSQLTTTPFVNAKVLTSIKPENECMPWLIPARFNAYRMPKTLISEELTMPVEDYVTAMEMLTNDYRFRLYTVCYRRIISAWLIFSLFLLLAILFSGVKSWEVFLLVLTWMFVVAVGILVCLVIKRRITIGIHHCVRSVNQILIRHNLMLGVEDRGKLSCHKIVIHFLYFRTSDCMPKIMQLLSQHDQQMLARGLQPDQIDVRPPSVAVNIEGPSQPQVYLVERAKKLILKYSQVYVKSVARGLLKFPSTPAQGVSEFVPLHAPSRYCLCQYLQKFHFERVPKKWYERFF